jgi:hypothetical protein
MRRMAIDPSPTAEATRFTVPRRTSPTANTPGMLVSSMNGARRSGQRASVSGPVLYFAGWKRHISLYPAPAGDEALERRLGPYRAAKSTLKFPLSQPVPYDLIAQVAKLSLRQRQDGGGAG